MNELSPSVVLVAGPNGAGKSTAAPALLRDYLGIREFVNADVIARGLSGFDPDKVAVQAGRIMLRRMHELADQRVDFAFETTLAARSFAPWLRELRDAGYRTHLLFLWLPSPEMAIARVTDRVRRGGHHVPDETVRRRYHAGLRNFFRLYVPFLNCWMMFDNSSRDGYARVASQLSSDEIHVANEAIWRSIRGQYG